ncbi:MAG: PadR family transcriptional regulator [Saccharofermentanales bacterium]
MESKDDALNNLVQELRRGTIVLCVLSQLKEPRYGYSLVQGLEEKGLAIDAGTLYPLLRRLEKQEMLISAWETSGTKPRKYYSLSDKGKVVYNALCKEWDAMVCNMSKMLNC